jgi:hypothetical protein
MASRTGIPKKYCTKNAVHDVNMKPIGFTVVDHFDVAAPKQALMVR